jgi:hypothetical protein
MKSSQAISHKYGVTIHRLTPTTVRTDSLIDMDMGLQESVMGANKMSSHVTHHIYPEDGGRDSLWNTGL